MVTSGFFTEAGEINIKAAKSWKKYRTFYVTKYKVWPTGNNAISNKYYLFIVSLFI